MKEIKAIIKAYDEIDRSVMRAAIATVVRVEGSSYRRTGARMLVLDNGTWVGGISGGCLEGDALKRARVAINNSRPTLITYDTSEDDPHQIGVGLGCNGIIDVLFCPLDFNDPNNPVEVLKTCIQASRETHILITISSVNGDFQDIKPGQLIQYKGPESLTIIGDQSLESSVDHAVKQRIADKKSGSFTCEAPDGRSLAVFIEILPPEIHVVLMGHQYDVYPMCRLLKEIGWRVSIVAELLKVNSKISALADEIRAPSEFFEMLIDEHTAIILMSHDYKTDKINLPKALRTSAPFIGMLGPKVRSEKIWKELADEGRPVNESEMERIYAPLGLDIGAQTPEEIALSLAAGIRAAFSGRNGAFLKYRKSPIHPRS
ncbi:Xanthine and CO dehydrogenase maturation factor, XdhC/CoxF family [Daejeonella rubra]|uniref:Xanthine and CO dehydrogenase maturation factor, XdhC/CoxF family n=1 Tax=Daejeonella rubra TaxID=990371 RepID=A0A1G9TBR8_9SPHI|nr:XdhC family protein [Daejeonella rubra]SDM45179.1 Xanthine and CO dehydrogenase maturation factor, XdhC/CoxF family [Daejeonella rubra]